MGMYGHVCFYVIYCMNIVDIVTSSSLFRRQSTVHPLTCILCCLSHDASHSLDKYDMISTGWNEPNGFS